MSEENVVETKLCRACNQVKVARSFHRSNGVLHPRCKQCKLEGKKISRKLVDYSDRRKTYFKLVKPTKDDYIETYTLLEKMGYDLKQDIHIQFCEKHNLEPHTPKKEFKPHISIQECFDFS
jgi:hypothetical protein